MSGKWRPMVDHGVTPGRRSLAMCGACASLVLVACVTLLSCDPDSGLDVWSGRWVGQDSEARSMQHVLSRPTEFSQNAELIFVGGVPRSGTTLMRVLLDAHPDVRCGQETRVIPRILGMRTGLQTSREERERLEAAGVTGEVLDSAVRAFILEIVAKHGPAAPRLCNKDPFTLKSAIYLAQQFPRAKFILMIRDGRAVVHSIITHGVRITGFKLDSWSKCLQKWSQAMETMYRACVRVGPERCLPVYYEQLVLQPRLWLERVLAFLGLSWADSLLHHQDFIGPEIVLSRTELSSEQVKRALYRDSLTAWVATMPRDLGRLMARLAPMLATLGYDPTAWPPDYSHPPTPVASNTLHLADNRLFWMTGPRDPFDRDRPAPPVANNITRLQPPAHTRGE